MNESLYYFIKQWNPLRDFDDIKLLNHIGVESGRGQWITQFKNIRSYCNVVKPFARGGIVGGAIGAGLSYIVGESPTGGFKFGASCGSTIDFYQWTARFLYRYIKAQSRQDNP